MHKEPHDKTGQTITVASGQHAGRQMVVIDWWDHKIGKSWKESYADGIIPAVVYLSRQVQEDLPDDDEVVHCVARDTPHPMEGIMIREDILLHQSEIA